MHLRSLLLLLSLGLTGCAEAIWRVDSAALPQRWAQDSHVQQWPRPLHITYTFWASGRVTADVSPAHEWWKHVHATGWEVDSTEGTNGYTTIRFDGITERYQRRYPQGEAVLFLVSPASHHPH